MAAVLLGLLGYVCRWICRFRVPGGRKQGDDGGLLPRPYSTLNLRVSFTLSTAPLLLRVSHAFLISLHRFPLSSPQLSFHREHAPQHTRLPLLPSVSSSSAHEPFLGSPGMLLKWLFSRPSRSAMALLLNPMALLCIHVRSDTLCFPTQPLFPQFLKHRSLLVFLLILRHWILRLQSMSQAFEYLFLRVTVSPSFSSHSSLCLLFYPLDIFGIH